ncbi:hypothetical protein PV439_43715 [Streptomyces scabiei]|nr:hypothetical protein [Streptomyces scabiei]MDX2898193.1 hypothetical protein [Streptomyces scabiei]
MRRLLADRLGTRPGRGGGVPGAVS